MKSKLGFLFVGLLLGFYLHSLWPQKGAEVASTFASVEATVSDPPLEKKQAENFVEMHDQRSDILVPARQEEAKPTSRLAREANGVQPESAQSLKLMINEETLSEMERHRDLLQNYAFTTQTAEGWKIQILPEDKVFLKTGLTSGDLITFESVDQQLQIPERAELANRLVSILNSIQR